MAEHQLGRGAGLPSQRLPHPEAIEQQQRRRRVEETRSAEQQHIDPQPGGAHHLPPHSGRPHIAGQELPVALSAATARRRRRQERKRRRNEEIVDVGGQETAGRGHGLLGAAGSTRLAERVPQGQGPGQDAQQHGGPRTGRERRTRSRRGDEARQFGVVALWPVVGSPVVVGRSTQFHSHRSTPATLVVDFFR